MSSVLRYLSSCVGGAGEPSRLPLSASRLAVRQILTGFWAVRVGLKESPGFARPDSLCFRASQQNSGKGL